VKLLATIALVLVLTVPAIACGGSEWEDVISRALVKTGEAWSYRSTGNTTGEFLGYTLRSSTESEHALEDFHEKSTTSCPGNDTAAGNVSVVVAAGGGCEPSWAEFTVIDGRAYMRSSRNPEWQECQLSTPGQATAPPTPGPTPYRGICTVEGTSLARELECLNWLIDVEKLPAEYVDGISCSHFRGRVDMDGYTDMLIERNRLERPGQPTPEPEILDLQRRQVRLVEVWIDDDEHIRQLTFDARFPFRYPTLDPDTSEEVWATSLSTILYFDFNQPITIEPPD
jgi:hypothetical protein